jgi:hypothetical protein
MNEILTSTNTTHRERYCEGCDVIQYGEIVGDMVAGGIVPPSRGKGKVSRGSRKGGDDVWKKLFYFTTKN